MSEHEEPRGAIPRDMVPGIVKAGAVGAVIGGAIWVVKGGFVLVGQREALLGIDLGILFVVVQGLFAVAVIGVEELLGERGARHAEVGLWFAYLSVLLSVVNLVIWVVAGTASVPGMMALIASLAWMIGAVLVGIPAMRTEVLPRPWHLGLIVIGAAALPLFLIFGWTANIIGQDRILEIPVILLGAVWVAFGLELWWAGWHARWAKRQEAT